MNIFWTVGGKQTALVMQLLVSAYLLDNFDVLCFYNAGLKVRHFVQSRLYEELQKVVDFFTGRTTYHPYDVSCNVIRSADNTHIHQDCEPGEDDVTLLIYLNPNWTRNLYGETVFYEKDEQGNYESKLAVRPRFGRIAVFNGVFPYSAQPPSPTFPGNN